MTKPLGEVYVYQNDTNDRLLEHQRVRTADLAGLIADSKGYTYGGFCTARDTLSETAFFVPGRTLLREDADKLGIMDENDLYGGIVPEPYMLTKSIVHELVEPDADQPEGWKSAFGQAVRDLVLPGYTVFSQRDAITAVARLLAEGHVARAKRSAAAGCMDQFVIASPERLEDVWARVPRAELERLGLVIEADIQPDFTVYAAGHMVLNGIRASFAGTIREVPIGHGQKSFGGTDVTIVRGDYDDLLARLPEGSDIAKATDGSRRFHRAAQQELGAVTSRTLYATIVGTGHDGRQYDGILEQSWRIGGSSGAEILAMRAFQNDKTLQTVRGATRTIPDSEAAAPEHARIHYRGDDSVYGSVTVYSAITPIEHG